MQAVVASAADPAETASRQAPLAAPAALLAAANAFSSAGPAAFDSAHCACVLANGWVRAAHAFWAETCRPQWLAEVATALASCVAAFTSLTHLACRSSLSAACWSAVEEALGDGPAELWVFDGNPRAEAFYRKLGFRRDGVEAPHRETGLPGIRMVRGG